MPNLDLWNSHSRHSRARAYIAEIGAVSINSKQNSSAEILFVQTSHLQLNTNATLQINDRRVIEIFYS